MAQRIASLTLGSMCRASAGAALADVAVTINESSVIKMRAPAPRMVFSGVHYSTVD
jgi:hypothetical protein